MGRPLLRFHLKPKTRRKVLSFRISHPFAPLNVLQTLNRKSKCPIKSKTAQGKRPQ
jgi:hypothetical protein